MTKMRKYYIIKKYCKGSELMKKGFDNDKYVKIQSEKIDFLKYKVESNSAIFDSMKTNKLRYLLLMLNI